jgi:Ca2+-binding RTX toxin-like protein
VGNELLCHEYGCEIDPASGVYACHTSSTTIHASSGADDVYTLYADDIVHGAEGDDWFGGSHGDDVVFGGAGADTFLGGPGLDAYLGGSGNDTFVIALDCQVVPGEVIDGGPGTDTVQSHLTRAELEGLGLTLWSVESFTTSTEGRGDCGEFAIEEGPWLKPRVALAWDDLPSTGSVHTTTASTLDLTIENLSDDAVSVDLTFSLTVRGFTVTYEPSTINVAASSSTGYPLDLDDFVPVGVDPQEVPEPWLDLPTSASLLVRGNITISSAAQGTASAPLVYGHLEDTGTTLVVYREEALADTYYGGDLLAWRRGSTPPPAGSGRVFEAHLVASP